MTTKVLDHGYIKLVERWGCDARVIEAARMSTGKGFLGWGPKHDPDCQVSSSVEGNHRCICDGGPQTGDEKLLRYLHENAHHTPFEMAGAIIEVQAPIFVFREWHRHRTQSYNEMSARYTPLPNENYVPTVERCLVVQPGNKQAAGLDGTALTHESVLEWLEELAHAYDVSERCYQSGVRRGIPKELARLPVPVARYSRMRASANLRNWLAFLTLRSEKNPQAQWEIRQFGAALADLLRPVFPRTFHLFEEKGRAS